MKKSGPPIPRELRSRAEERLGESPALGTPAEAMEGQDLRKLVHERYLDLYDFAPVGYLTLDAGGVIREANLAGASLLGVPRGELAGRPLALSLAPESRPAFAEFLARVISGQHGLACEASLQRTGGKTVHLQLGGEAFGAVPGCRVVLVDVTARHEAERAREDALAQAGLLNALLTEETARANEMTVQARAATIAKSSFLASMSHEIRTPMNAILGFAQLLGRDRTLARQQGRYVETILRSGEHLLALISDILEYSKIESGEVSVEEATFDLDELLQEFSLAYRIQAEAKGLRLRLEHRGRTPRYVVTDETKLRQVLRNLLVNALKFTSDGGVTIGVAFEPGREEAAAGRLVVEVEDSGVGIAPEETGRLFSAFVQTESGRTAKSGTGLGLVISRSLARLLGGTLEVTSRPGLGSIFRLEIPVREGAEASVLRRPRLRRVAALEPGQEGLRILVVDDNEDNRAFLEQLLVSVGFEVRSVEDGARAVIEFEAMRPQLILMDLRMPVLTGCEAILRIRGQAGGTAVRIIAVTASAFQEDRLQAMQAGADDFVSKPLRESVLLEKIKTLLGVRYRYAEEDAGAIPVAFPLLPAPPVELLLGEAAALPGDLVAELREAALIADLDRILELTGQVEAHAPTMAQELRNLAEGFAYPGILALLERGRGRDGAVTGP